MTIWTFESVLAQLLVIEIKKMITVETKEISTFKSQLSKLENQALEIKISNQEENDTAINLKSKVKSLAKSIKERKEEITKPLNDSLKSVRQLFAPIEEQIENADEIIGRKLLDYKRKVDEQLRLEAEKIAKKAEEGKIKLETAEKKLDKLEEKKVETTTVTQHGKVQFRKIKKIKITDLNLIPDAYWIIDEVKLRKDMLAGIVVPGATVYEEEIV